MTFDGLASSITVAPSPPATAAYFMSRLNATHSNDFGRLPARSGCVPSRNCHANTPHGPWVTTRSFLILKLRPLTLHGIERGRTLCPFVVLKTLTFAPLAKAINLPSGLRAICDSSVMNRSGPLPEGRTNSLLFHSRPVGHRVTFLSVARAMKRPSCVKATPLYWPSYLTKATSCPVNVFQTFRRLSFITCARRVPSGLNLLPVLEYTRVVPRECNLLWESPETSQTIVSVSSAYSGSYEVVTRNLPSGLKSSARIR